MQQTVVATVLPHFERFTTRWPDLAALAAATEDEVLAAWSGLGYYARARNLHRAARAVVASHGGELPEDEEVLRALPGIGAYTAAAVAAIAFGRRTFALDGNAARVVARLAGDRDPIDQPAVRQRLRALGQTWVPATRAGDFAQAVMELGATVCTPRRPDCGGCPLGKICIARADDLVAQIPAKTPRAEKRPVRLAAVRVRRGGRILLVRGRTGLLAGTWMLPAGELPPGTRERPTECEGVEKVARAAAESAARAANAGEPFVLDWSTLRRAGQVRHVFTHRDVTVDVFDVRAGDRPPNAAQVRTTRRLTPSPTAETSHLWASPRTFATLALSTYVRKQLDLAVSAPDAPSSSHPATRSR